MNVISPGAIETERMADRYADASFRRAVAAKIPVGRPGRPEDCVGPAIFLCSDEASLSHRRGHTGRRRLDDRRCAGHAAGGDRLSVRESTAFQRVAVGSSSDKSCREENDESHNEENDDHGAGARTDVGLCRRRGAPFHHLDGQRGASQDAQRVRGQLQGEAPRCDRQVRDDSAGRLHPEAHLPAGRRQPAGRRVADGGRRTDLRCGGRAGKSRPGIEQSSKVTISRTFPSLRSASGRPATRSTGCRSRPRHS